jgi:hypothetical protein
LSLWSSPLIGVIGTLMGALLGSFLTSARDRTRWSREMLISQVDRRTTYLADVCSAIDLVVLIYGIAADGVLGQRAEIDERRISATDETWREVLTRRCVYASDDLQSALASFDRARAARVEAILARDPNPIALSEQRLTAARLHVLDAVQKTVNETNEALGFELTPWRRRLWARIRRRPWYPIAAMPSKAGFE